MCARIDDKRRLVALAIAAAFLASPAAAETWVPAGTEGSARVAVGLDAVPTTRTEPQVTAVLAMIPAGWPGSTNEYSVWIARFDCDARTRTVTHRITYSSRHDPRREPGSGMAVSDQGSAAIARQLDIVCGDKTTMSAGAFDTEGSFAASLGRPR